MTTSSDFLINADVMDTHPDGFCVYEKQVRAWNVDRTESGFLSFRLNATTPALVMNHQYAGPLNSFTKKEFQSVHNGSADEGLQEKILTAYGQNADTFRENTRTIGCGSNVYFQCDDGLYQALVQRTAPGKTPEGVVQPGAFSRAAGGATGSLLETQVREMTEELNVFIKTGDDRMTSADIMRVSDLVSQEYQENLFSEKKQSLSEIYNQVAAKTGVTDAGLQIEPFKAYEVYVDGLHEHVEQDIAGNKTEFLAVVADDPKNGDVSGVDTILVVPMPGVHSSQIYIADGERNPQGTLLNRTWVLAKPEFLEANLREGTMKFSPVLAKILQKTPQVIQTINGLNL